MSINNKIVKDRIRTVIRHFNLTISKFSELIDSHQSTVSRALSEGGVFGENLINKVVIAFGINKEWISDGIGQMMDEKEAPTNPQSNSDLKDVLEKLLKATEENGKKLDKLSNLLEHSEENQTKIKNIPRKNLLPENEEEYLEQKK